MKVIGFSIILMMGCFFIAQPVFALDSAQKKAMNAAITGQSGQASISSSSLNGQTSTTNSYSDAVSAVQLAIGSVIAIIYLLFVAWLAKTQYVAWAEGDREQGEASGAIVRATLLLLLIVFIVTYAN